MSAGGTMLVPARPEQMVAGGRVLGEDGGGRVVTGPAPIIDEWRISL